MKNIFKISLALAAAAGLLFGCAPMDKDEHGLGTAPSESQLSFTQTAGSSVSANIITLTNTSSAKGVALWDLGNGNTAKGDVVTASYPFAGSYTVTMSLFTEGGGATISQVINIAEDDYGLLDTPGFNALTGGADATEGKTWVLAKYTAGHIAVDDVNAAPKETGRWWDCPPLGKEGCSLYDNEYTFIQRGTKLIWTNNGQIYTNEAGMNHLGIAGTPNATVGDYDVPYVPADNLTFTLDEDNMVLTLSSGGFLAFYCGATSYNILRLTEHELTVWCRSAAEPGNAWYFTFVPKDELKEPDPEPEVPKDPKPESEDAWFRPNQPTNLLGSAFTYESWFSGADWGGGLEPGVSVKNEITITVPDGIGGSEWMGQFKIHTGVPAAAWESFDFSANIKATQAGTATIKMTADSDPSDDEFFYDGNIQIGAGETVLFENPDKRLYDATSSILLVFDFGRFPAGTVITISDLCLQRHIPLSEKPVVENLWPGASVTTTYWFSAADWAGTLAPTFEMSEDNGFELTVPDGIGGSEWMGQFAIHTDIEAKASHAYEFSCNIEADSSSEITLKLTNDPESDDKVFFYDGAVSIKNGTTVYRQKNIKPASADVEALMLIFDFGRTPAGTKIKVSDIVFQEFID
ncbi:MAG: PKD domain-containing protein [Bacteroidales bacterium]|nr:PKD domain-containing protein [Bacteroidales bacterium]